MKRLLAAIFFVTLLSGCKNGTQISHKYQDADTKFIVVGIENDESLYTNSIYSIEVVDLNGFTYDHNNSSSNLVFSFTDAKNKFILGEIIKFNKIDHYEYIKN